MQEAIDSPDFTTDRRYIAWNITSMRGEHPTHLGKVKISMPSRSLQVKVLEKAAIFDKKSIVIVQGEVDVLARMEHPFIIHLFAVYQVK